MLKGIAKMKPTRQQSHSQVQVNELARTSFQGQKMKMSENGKNQHVMTLLTLLAISLSSLQLVQMNTVSASDIIQPANQLIAGSALQNQASELGQQSQAAQAASARVQQPQSAQTQTQAQRLPKINIYINKNEIKKLLGIDTRINYVTNGNINSYPLGFTIPLGYNQSDIIFTWQNLGQTNVNYSISLVIGNIHAVEPPLINITRSGLIPKHEQVFKITLPCSGKVTDEVDVQVLINIVGQPATDDELLATPSALSEQQQQDLLAASQVTTSGAGNQSAAEFMQSDEAEKVGQAQVRLVSHTLAIKRKKICTVHPVQVAAPARSPAAHNWAPPMARADPAQGAAFPATASPTITSTNTMEAQLNRNNQPKEQQNGPSTPSAGQQNNEQQQQRAIPNPHLGEPQIGPELMSNQRFAANSAGAASFRHHQHHNQPPASQFNPLNNMQTRRPQSMAAQPAIDLSGSAGINQPASFYPNWPLPQQQQQAIGAGRNSPPINSLAIPADNPLNDIITSNRLQKQQQQQQQQPQAGNSVLILTLVGLSLLISIALIVVIILGSSSSIPNHRRSSFSSPLDKLRSLTSFILRRTPASRANKCNKSPIGVTGTVISSLRADLKSNASSVSGLSAVSGKSLAKQQAYCYKGSNGGANCGVNGGGFYTLASGNSTQYHQPAPPPPHHHHHHHRLYQQPPTADLLGSSNAYQCQPQQQQQQHQQYPIYHIATGNTSQTTRLIWNNGNGTSPDGFTIDGGSYMPLSNGPRSDSGSAYQTIY